MRPSLDPGSGESSALRVRFTKAQIAKLKALVDSGIVKTVSEAIRRCVDRG